MDQLQKKKLWTVLLAILIIANLATLGSFWYPKLMGGGPAGPGPNGDAASFISKELGFDKKQQAIYDVLRKEHQEKTRSVHDSLRMAKDHFFVSLTDTALDHTKLAAEIGRLESQLDLLTLQHFRQLRALCNGPQKVKFDGIIQQVLRMMGPRQGPPGGRPGGPPPQGNGQKPPPPPDGMAPPDGMPPPPGGQGPPPQ